LEYDTNYLAQVIARIDLTEPIPWVDKLPKEIMEAARAGFPIVETTPHFSGTVEIRADQGGSRLEHHEETRTEWAFHSAERNRHLKIGPTYVLVTCDSFRTYDDSIASGLEPVWDAVAERVDDLQTRRLGLRYVNHIPQTDESRDVLSWTNLVKKRICAVLNVPDPYDGLTRAVGISEYNLGDCLMRFQFGMPNPDYPSPLRQKMFLLDYDCFVETPVDSGEVLSVMDAMRQRIEALFEASITPALRRHLKGT